MKKKQVFSLALIMLAFLWGGHTHSPAATDGEYVVLSLPDEDLRFDFFLSEGKENLIREVHGDEEIALYQASFADDTRAAAVMRDWYDALVADRDMRALGYTPDSLLGNWAEKSVGRGTIAISARADGRYDVQINWSSSAAEMNVWTMTARPAASHMLRYEDCRPCFDHKGGEKKGKKRHREFPKKKGGGGRHRKGEAEAIALGGGEPRRQDPMIYKKKQSNRTPKRGRLRGVGRGGGAVLGMLCGSGAFVAGEGMI